jgi:charged multivesicular body protein 6
MKNQRDKLRQYQKRITVLTDREKAIAKECLAKGDTNKAKLALRRKKYQEGLIQKTDAQLAQLEQLTNDVEFALVQKDVLYGLQQGTAVLKEIHKEMGGIENVEKLLGENAEARAYQEVRMAAFPISVSSILISAVTGNQRAAGEQDVEPRRRRSQRRARGSRTRSQRRLMARCTQQATRVHAGTEGADGKRPLAKSSSRACCRAGAAGRAHVGIAQPAYVCIERGVGDNFENSDSHW